MVGLIIGIYIQIGISKEIVIKKREHGLLLSHTTYYK